MATPLTHLLLLSGTTQQIRSRGTDLHTSGGGHRELLNSGPFAPGVIKTLAVYLEHTPNHPTTAQVHPAGALAVISPASNSFTDR